MKKLLIFTFVAVGLLVFSGNSLFAQKVYTVDSKYDADIKVYVCSSKYDADLCVYKVSSAYDVNDDGLWFFTSSKYDAKKKVYFVDSKYDADLLIYFVDSKYDAKWNNNSKKHLIY
ncbi:MAG: hypothetical protein HXX09_15490 [Bacteroidetes bacterium]|jgi:hypothetical protein|nr:hypothetical protein [Bacteroidota bacterium]